MPGRRRLPAAGQEPRGAARQPGAGPPRRGPHGPPALSARSRSSRRPGLGRGLDALLPDVLPGGAGTEATLIEVDPAQVRANPEQPRRDFDPASLQALAESIRLHGLLHPIVVERATGSFQLVAGERRLRAARLVELSSIPAIVRPAAESGRHALELALTENLVRADLGPMEQAAAYSRLADAFGLSHEAIALRTGRTRSAVSNTIRLLSLSAGVQEALAEGRLSAGHARALLALPDPARQEELAARIERHGLSVREVERSVQNLLQARTSPSRSASGRSRPDPDQAALLRGFETALGAPVEIVRRGAGGRLIIPFGGDEDLNALYQRIGGPPL